MTEYKIGDRIKDILREGTLIGLTTNVFGDKVGVIAEDDTFGIYLRNSEMVAERPVNEGDTVTRTFEDGTVITGVIERFEVFENVVVARSAEPLELPLWNHKHPEQTTLVKKADRYPDDDVLVVTLGVCSDVLLRHFDGHFITQVGGRVEKGSLFDDLLHAGDYTVVLRENGETK